MATTTKKDIHRDDFASSTKELIAKKSGYICSYPGCQRMTVAGSEDRKSGLTMTGVAAHITAASKDGPRYASAMSQEERASETNGIWTCQIHGKFIDDNPSECTIEELRRWKFQHEKWVFERVESGRSLFNEGITKISFANIGVFDGEYSVSLGRQNVLVGNNGSGKTTFCEIVSSFSGGKHWAGFNKRFSFNKSASNKSYIGAISQIDTVQTSVKISSQHYPPTKRHRVNPRQYFHIELNGSPSVDWPRSLFKVIFFKDQLYRNRSTDPKDTFISAIRYLASVFATSEELIWDSLRDELFTSTLLGYRFHRTGYRNVDVLVPDGRDFYVSHKGLSFTELHKSFVDIAIKLFLSSPKNEHWIFIFDTSFFERMDSGNKQLLFERIKNIKDTRLQTVFCLFSTKDAEMLKDLQPGNWVNAAKIQEVTIHSFL